VVYGSKESAGKHWNKLDRENIYKVGFSKSIMDFKSLTLGNT